MPKASEEMKRQLGLILNFSKPLLSGEIKGGGLLPGTPIAKGNPLSPRIETTKPQGDVRVSQDQPSTAIPSPIAAPQPGSGAPPITIEDFRKVQLKAAKVLSAERVPKSEKLLKLREIGRASCRERV